MGRRKKEKKIKPPPPTVEFADTSPKSPKGSQETLYPFQWKRSTTGVEVAWEEWWEACKFYSWDAFWETTKPEVEKFVKVLPPQNVTGSLHFLSVRLTYVGGNRILTSLHFPTAQTQPKVGGDDDDHDSDHNYVTKQRRDQILIDHFKNSTMLLGTKAATYTRLTPRSSSTVRGIHSYHLLKLTPSKR